MINNFEVDKLNNALYLLKDKGYVIKEFSLIGNGINSNCYKLCDNSNKYFLKFYKKRINDSRERLINEINFLEMLNLNQIKNIPKILYVNKIKNFCLFNWIEGENIKNPNYSDWLLYIKFLTDIQLSNNSKKFKKISMASEACFFLIDHFELISERLENLLITLSGNTKYNEIHKWLSKIILKEIIALKSHKYLNKVSNRKEGFLIKKVLSPSDVGFHNILRNGHELYFFDFEYSGWDDPYKLFVDLIIQPENILNKKLATKLLNKLARNLLLDLNYERLGFYIQIYKIKWVLIILNKLINNNLDKKKEIEELFIKVVGYHKRVSEIWL